MKKNLLLIFAAILFAAAAQGQQRYRDSVFASVTITTDKVYGQNYSVFTSTGPNYVTPELQPLRMDVYEPAGDTCTSRPLVIYLHEGSFAPILYNDACVGTKSDSSIVEICTQFAKRGYVAVSMDYRIGWNPQTPDQDTRTGTIFQAAYRSLIDAKSCVRYFKANPDTFKVDTTKIVIGGVGAGAVTALHYGALVDTNQLWLQKLISTTTNATYGFVLGKPFVDIHRLGDLEGYGGNPAHNYANNNPGHTTNVQMIFSINGVLADSDYVIPSLPPIVAMHPMTPINGTSPYQFGTVSAATFPVLFDVVGPHFYICRMDSMGLNNVINLPTMTDPYTTRANSINSGCDGLFPWITGINPFTGNTEQEDMFDWYSQAAMEFIAPFIGLTPADADTAYAHSIKRNPNMSKTQALAYIDTIKNYLCPRIQRALNLAPGNNCSPVGIDENSKPLDNISVYPNPAGSELSVICYSLSGKGTIAMYNTLGEKVLEKEIMAGEKQVKLNVKNLSRGIYLVKVFTSNGSAVKKITLE